MKMMKSNLAIIMFMIFSSCYAMEAKKENNIKNKWLLSSTQCSSVDGRLLVVAQYVDYKNRDNLIELHKSFRLAAGEKCVEVLKHKYFSSDQSAYHYAKLFSLKKNKIRKEGEFGFKFEQNNNIFLIINNCRVLIGHNKGKIIKADTTNSGIIIQRKDGTNITIHLYNESEEKEV